MKILYVTTISLTMNSFFKPHIQMLIEEGYQVEIACNNKDLALDPLYEKLGCKLYQIDFSRSPLSIDNMKAYSQLKKIIENGCFDVVHCHTPNASVITRLVCRKFRKNKGLKVFYTAHGFHFYKGAPMLNWMIYYPIEKLCSYFTDKLITINHEDFALAKKKFKAKEVLYVPGVGVDLSRFQNVQVDRNAKRQEIGVPEDSFLLLSVGELNENKNHQVVIRALAELHNPAIHYAIAGVGDKKDYLLNLAEELGVSYQVHLLGYRADVVQLYRIADTYILPSIREGLNASLMEAMACGLPVICGNIRGNTDLIGEESGLLVKPRDTNGFYKNIGKLVKSPGLCLANAERNRFEVKNFEIKVVLEKMKKIYLSC